MQRPSSIFKSARTKVEGAYSGFSSKWRSFGSSGRIFCRWRLAVLARYVGLGRYGIGTSSSWSRKALLTIWPVERKTLFRASSTTAARILWTCVVPGSAGWQCCDSPGGEDFTVLLHSSSAVHGLVATATLPVHSAVLVPSLDVV